MCYNNLMGSKSPELYSCEVPDQAQPANQTKIRRNSDYLSYLSSSPTYGVRTMSDVFRTTFKKFQTKNFLGTIKNKTAPTQPGKHSNERKVGFMSYGEVQVQSRAIGSAILELGLAAPVQDEPGRVIKIIGLCSKSRPEWVLVDIGCILYGIVDVAIYDTITPENLSQVVRDSHITTLFCSAQILSAAIKASNLWGLKKIVCFDNVDVNSLGKLLQKGVKCYSFKSLVDLGLSRSNLYQPPICVPNQCMTLICPSGTTGQASGQTKFLMMSHMNFTACCSVVPTNTDFGLTGNDTHFSYMPLAHVFERSIAYWMATCGGQIMYYSKQSRFYSGDLMKLRDDMQIASPTVFVSVPRLLNLISDRMKKTFEEIQGCQKALLDKAYQTKIRNLETKGDFRHWFYDMLIFKKVRSMFGSRVRAIVSGSAPLSSQIHTFLKVVTGLPILQGYGLSETCGPTFMMHYNDPTTGHVGGPTSNNEFKLVDLPEMGYTHNDVDQQGKPCPRGQVCIKGPSVFLGYFQMPEKTKQVIDSQGWLHTGDIGAILPNGALRIIDRKLNVFKLQNGQYISPEKVQEVFLRKKDISEMFIYGDPMEHYAVAVIVPLKQSIMALANTKHITGEFSQLCLNPQIKQEFLRQHNRFVLSEGLISYEIPQNVYLQSLTFLERGILTSTMKLQRYKAKTAYAKQIAEMYKQGRILKDEEGISVTSLE